MDSLYSSDGIETCRENAPNIWKESIYKEWFGDKKPKITWKATERVHGEARNSGFYKDYT